MRRKLSLVIAFIGVLGLIGFAPAADATHDGGAKDGGNHEAQPLPPAPDPEDVGAVCNVAGSVIVDDSASTGGVAASEPWNHNHYEFEGTTITCTPLDAAFNDFAGDYDVDATGGTDGSQGTTSHGENDLLGWSHSDGYTDSAGTVQATHKTGATIESIYAGTSPGCGGNCGEIWATNTSGGKSSDVSTDNAVLFLREGTNVQAWGILFPNNGKAPVCFLAELEFIPELKDPGEKVNEAELLGEAELWFGPKGDPLVPGTCGTDQGDNKK